jgi:hypothetical protein
VILFLCVLTFLSWVARLSGPIDLRWDGAVYYILGTSLAEGKGYRLLNEPGEIEAVQYPPLLPAIIAGHQWLLGTTDFLIVGEWLRRFFFLLSVAFTIAAYSLARLYLSRGYALLSVSVCGLYLNTYYLSDLLYTELPFALVTVLFVILNRKSDRLRYILCTAVLGITAYLLRTAGIALLAAWVAESMLRRRFKQMTFRAAAALVPIILWQAHITGVEESHQYRQPAYTYQRAPYQYSNVTYIENTLLIDPFIPEKGRITPDEMFKRIVRNLMAMPSALGEAVSAPISYWRWPLVAINDWSGLAVVPLWLVVTPIVILGCVVVAGGILLTRQEWFLPLYLTASTGLMLVTPWPEQFTRYLMPLTPFLTLCLFYALAVWSESDINQNLRRWKRPISSFTILIVAMIFAVQGITLISTYGRERDPVSYYDRRGNKIMHRLFFYDPPWQAVDTALEWLRRRANRGDVIATTVPHSAYLRTGLKAVLMPIAVDSVEAQRLLDSVPVKYIVVDDLPYPGISQRYAAPLVAKHPDLWRRVYVTPTGKARVYERTCETRKC